MDEKQKNVIDEAINDLIKINCRLTFLKEISNIEGEGKFDVNELDNYGYGKSLMIEDLQKEINRITDNIQELLK